MKRIERKNNLMKAIEQTHGGDIEEIMRVLYVEHEMTIYELAQHLNISYLTAQRWLKRAGIYSKRIALGD